MRNDVVFGIYLSCSAISFSLLYFFLHDNLDLTNTIISSSILGLLLYAIIKYILKRRHKKNDRREIQPL